MGGEGSLPFPFQSVVEFGGAFAVRIKHGCGPVSWGLTLPLVDREREEREGEREGKIEREKERKRETGNELAGRRLPAWSSIVTPRLWRDTSLQARSPERPPPSSTLTHTLVFSGHQVLHRHQGPVPHFFWNGGSVIPMNKIKWNKVFV